MLATLLQSHDIALVCIAAVSAIAGIVSSLISNRNRGKLDGIHMLVNGRLDSALDEIKGLRAEMNEAGIVAQTPKHKRMEAA